MNKKFYEKQLADLKRANKTRKVKLAVENGYISVESYKKALELALLEPGSEPIVETEDVVSKEKPRIHNVTILDNSASMSGNKFKNAYNGIVDEIKELKKNTEIEYTQTFCHFRETPIPSIPEGPVITHRNVPISKFRLPIIGTNACTPLYDSIIKVCTELAVNNKPKTKVLIQIFTDGDDTASKNNAHKAKSIIETCKSLGMTVTFIATKSDVSRIIRDLDIDESNTLIHNNTAKGIKDAFETRSRALETYSSKVIKGEDVELGFYKTL